MTLAEQRIRIVETLAAAQQHPVLDFEPEDATPPVICVGQPELAVMADTAITVARAIWPIRLYYMRISTRAVTADVDVWLETVMKALRPGMHIGFVLVSAEHSKPQEAGINLPMYQILGTTQLPLC